MRILHAVRSDGFAGVERHVARLARAQSALGHQVTMVGGDARPVRRTLDGAPVRHVPAATTPDVVRALLRHGPGADVVHVHMTAAEIAATVAGTLRPDVGPVVTTRHFARRRGSGRLGPLVGAVARHRVTAQIAVSRFVAEAVDGDCVVVHPGVDPVPTTPAPAASRTPTVLVAQRLEPEKRTDRALEAFAVSGLARDGWTLEVAGDGSERPALEKRASELGIVEDVRFLGVRDDVEQLMTTAALLLAPCPVEGLGLSVLEAMAAGLPVVAADAGGHRELLRGLDPDVLCPPDDAAAAGRALGALAASPARRDATAAEARDRQRRLFSPDVQAETTVRTYRDVRGAS
ncbi:glycosyltransferase family 4 protein [Isoptericola haloaureus]|uniref:Glycosyltransferase family 4 protein n=1 Tax=Isoptericola haloaureus TaxID=1542902 RepID=A0ABU7Z4S6_9MICO